MLVRLFLLVKKMKILLTAFDPFGGEKINPALEAVRIVRTEDLNADIMKIEVPTVFGKSIATVYAKMKEINPDVVLCIGQAGGRSALTPERVAINIDDARINDNEGNQPIDVAIFEDGASAYFSDLPIKAMVEAMKKEGLPATVSNSAGTFVCNHLMYGVLYYISKEFPNCRGGFMHVPFIPEQVVNRSGVPYMELEDIAKGIHTSLRAIIEYKQDLKITGGKEC